MILEYKRKLLSPTREDRASMVVVRDNHGRPMVIIEEHSDSLVVVTTYGEEGFGERLKALGID